MAKYNKTQINHILGRLKKAQKSRWSVAQELTNNLIPKKPAAVVKYEEAEAAARKKVESEVNRICNGQEAYIQSVEDKLVLGDSDFDLEAAIKELTAIK